MDNFISIISKEKDIEKNTGIVLEALINIGAKNLAESNDKFNTFVTDSGDTVHRLPLAKSLNEEQAHEFAQKLADKLFDAGYKNFEIEMSADDEVIVEQRLDEAAPIVVALMGALLGYGFSQEQARKAAEAAAETPEVKNEAPRVQPRGDNYDENLLRRGSRGEGVKELQRRLGMQGNEVDGIFGPATERAVRTLQQNQGLAVDGIVGPNTKAAIDKLAAPEDDTAPAQTTPTDGAEQPSDVAANAGEVTSADDEEERAVSRDIATGADAEAGEEPTTRTVPYNPNIEGLVQRDNMQDLLQGAPDIGDTEVPDNARPLVQGQIIEPGEIVIRKGNDGYIVPNPEDVGIAYDMVTQPEEPTAPRLDNPENPQRPQQGTTAEPTAPRLDNPENPQRPQQGTTAEPTEPGQGVYKIVTGSGQGTSYRVYDAQGNEVRQGRGRGPRLPSEQEYRQQQQQTGVGRPDVPVGSIQSTPAAPSQETPPAGQTAAPAAPSDTPPEAQTTAPQQPVNDPDENEPEGTTNSPEVPTPTEDPAVTNRTTPTRPTAPAQETPPTTPGTNDATQRQVQQQSAWERKYGPAPRDLSAGLPAQFTTQFLNPALEEINSVSAQKLAAEVQGAPPPVARLIRDRVKTMIGDAATMRQMAQEVEQEEPDQASALSTLASMYDTLNVGVARGEVQRLQDRFDDSVEPRPKGAFVFRERNEWDAKYSKTHNRDGSPKMLNESVMLDEYTVEDHEDFHEHFGYLGFVDDEGVFEAEYRGRKVKLNKPMAGDVKKFKVYVKNKKGNVVKVNFGQKGMKIKKSNPARRRSFRARHNCDNPGPKWKARYWSCRKW
jgi:peptidoglycan hydrolase-like protein with peptidoglycan-binding domain